MKKILLLLAFFAGALLYSQEPIQCQDVTIQLDETGEATITSSDVLVNSSGTLIGLRYDNDSELSFDYDGLTQSLEMNDEISICNEIVGPLGSDINPINNEQYFSLDVLDAGYSFFSECSTGGEYWYQGFGVFCELPLTFAFDRNGILYFIPEQLPSTLSTFEISSNTYNQVLSSGFQFDYFGSGITYNFDNHSILISTLNQGNLKIFEFNIENQTIIELFEIFVNEESCANAIQYVGENQVVIGGHCESIFLININSQESAMLINSGLTDIEDFIFEEDLIENSSVNVSSFNCDDIGENNVISQVELNNGEIITCESTVTIVPKFEFFSCRNFAFLEIDEASGLGIIPDLTQNLQVISSCSSNFTIVQNPPSGTLVPLDQFIEITNTATDELGQSTVCNTKALASTLSISEYELKESLSFYPNPTTTSITLRNDNNTPLTKVEMTDIRGRVIETIDLSTMTTEKEIDMTNYASGVYFAHITAGDIVVIKRVIKKS